MRNPTREEVAQWKYLNVIGDGRWEEEERLCDAYHRALDMWDSLKEAIGELELKGPQGSLAKALFIKTVIRIVGEFDESSRRVQ